MRSNFVWILLLIIPCVPLNARSLSRPGDSSSAVTDGRDFNEDYHRHFNTHDEPKSDDPSEQANEQVISVRITSSIAVDRGKVRSTHKNEGNDFSAGITQTTLQTEAPPVTSRETFLERTKDLPLSLAGANIEFIKQLNLKKGLRSHSLDQMHPYQQNIRNNINNESDDSIAEPSIKSVANIDGSYNFDELEDDVPLARSVPLSPPSKNFIQDVVQKATSERANSKLTTVSFNVVHDAPKSNNFNQEQSNNYKSPSNNFVNTPTVYSVPEKVYSEPAKVYSEPAKFYSEPAKIYSEPAKVYSEPAKVYSEPAKIYSEPAKFYSQPASLHLSPDISEHRTPWHQTSIAESTTETIDTTPSIKMTETVFMSTNANSKGPMEHAVEKNYEIDEKVSVKTDGRTHGVQDSNGENCKQDNCKVGYVVEGRQYRKYRVEERTPDGFIVGEYGVVRNEDGALRGVRYTADSEASPRLIHDALMKFLQL